MKLRQVVVSGSLAALLAFVAGAPTWAAQADDTTQGASAAPSKKSVRAANHAFSRKVQKHLQHTKGLEQSTIAAFGNAKTGQVTLAGQVVSEDQANAAVAAAKQVQGVTSVTSKLTLREQGGG